MLFKDVGGGRRRRREERARGMAAGAAHFIEREREGREEEGGKTRALNNQIVEHFVCCN